MLKLIQNEWLKISKTKSIMIAFLIPVLFCVIAAAVMHDKAEEKEGTWQEQLIKANEMIEKEMGLSKEQLQGMDDTEYSGVTRWKENQYHLDHDIEPFEQESALGFMYAMVDMKRLTSITMLILIVYGAQMVAKEHSYGTIKFLLTRSHSRSKILGAKYISLLLFGALLYLFSVGISFFAGFLFFGNDTPLFMYRLQDGVMLKEHVVILIGKHTVWNFIGMMSYVTLAFMIQTVVKNSAVAVGISLFVGLFAATVVLGGYDWMKYLLFTNTDLTVYETGVPEIDGMTFSFSFGIVMLYYAIFIGVAFLSFNKRDIV
ncbi:ABC transporter permease subunit [Bacillus sp. 165]|uniref:ABC transporter permease n=1 Tax=Bacillus sp. 165 TaxID=1529117 RepID=UPI001ADCFF91|nr:ABC transporter permease subunit [Bacillus sp. 165]MBO9129501.1 ABC transporter permease subunit [Bacillus sp. 165]